MATRSTTAGQSVQEVITSKVVRIIKSKDPDATVYLFGSRARNDAHDDSDWDFFVATNQPNPRKFEDQLIEEVYDVMLEHDELIQILAYPKKDWKSGSSPSPIYDEIRREGIEV
jgi:predicted nucleotidyltransferase